MRKLGLLLVFILSAAVVNAQPQSIHHKTLNLEDPSHRQFFEAYAEEEDRVLSLVEEIVPDSSAVERWVTDLVNLEPYLKQELPKLRGKTLYVILQLHYIGTEESPDVAASQAMTLTALQELKPKLLTQEGAYFDQFSRQTLLMERDQTDAELHLTFVGDGEHESDPAMTEWSLSHDAVLRYAAKHPGCRVIGAEWRGVHLLDMILMSHPNPTEEVEELFDRLARVRSWNTAARVSDFMQKMNLNEGVIVIGAGHAEDFEILAHVFGAKVVFYDVVP